MCALFYVFVGYALDNVHSAYEKISTQNRKTQLPPKWNRFIAEDEGSGVIMGEIDEPEDVSEEIGDNEYPAILLSRVDGVFNHLNKDTSRKSLLDVG